MLSFRTALLTAVFGVAAACAVSSTASANNYPPPALTNGANPNPGLIITFGSNGSITTTGTGVPYITEDEYIEVINNTSSKINSINLVTPTGASTGIFAFDGDGIDNYGAGSNALDHSGIGGTQVGAYGGADSYFTNISANDLTGTVNFIGGLNGVGGKGYFSLEGIIALNQSIVATPEPASLALFGAGLAGIAMMRRRRSSS